MCGAWLVGEISAGLVGQPASAAAAVDAGSADAAAPDVHVARAGDTLWSIADEYRGDIGRERFIDALVTLNGGTSVYIGQAVVLP